MALRPEGTASVVRAFVQHRPPVAVEGVVRHPGLPLRAPQAGRYRQHHQLGVEALGTDDPDLDVEVIALAAGFYAEPGAAPGRAGLNSMGCAACRPAYVAALLDYLAEHAERAVRRAPGALRGQPAAGARLQDDRRAGP